MAFLERHNFPSRLTYFTMYVALASLYVVIPTSMSSSYSFENGTVPEFDHEVTISKHFREPYDERYYGKLNIGVIETTTSSIRVTWHLSDLIYADSSTETTVICETFNGKIVSDKLGSPINSFKFEFLHSNTKYLICVYLLEIAKSSNTSVLHYNCQFFSTIPIVRSDSLVGVILTLGYLLVMGGIGYFVWRRRANKAKKSEEEEKMNIEDDEDDKEDDANAKREKRGSNSGRSGRNGGGVGGISNVAAESPTADADASASDVNGGSGFKAKSGRASRGSRGSRGSSGSGGASGAATGASSKMWDFDGDETVRYNANEREISF